MITRLSGTLTARPDPQSAVGARYYATDEQKVYVSGGESWYLCPGAPEPADVPGYLSGPLADRPSPAGHIGWIFTDSVTGNQYEAFPTGWALVNDVTPPAPGGGVPPGGDSGTVLTKISGDDFDVEWDNISFPNLSDLNGSTLPTSDPLLSGQLWNSSGTVKVSAGL
jgi:hypothetical protein